MDVRYPRTARLQVIATGEPSETRGHCYLRLVVQKERTFSVEFETVRDEPTHPGSERHKGDLTTSLAEQRAPAVTPSTGQTAGAALVTERSLISANRRCEAQGDRRA